MESGLFEIQVEHLTEIGKARHISTASRQFGYSLFEQPSVEPKNDSSVSSATGEPQTAQPTTQDPPNSWLITLVSWHVAFCGSQICPISHSIV
jgi:hypothetical protein